MNEVLALLLRRHRPDNESLSALLDGRLEGAAIERTQAHLSSCEACRARLDGLRQTRDALHALPAAEAPRSFRLRAADVQAPAPARRTPAAVRAMPVLAAAAALVFAVVLEADLARGGSSTGTAGGTAVQALSAGPRATASAGGGIGEIGPASSDNASPAAPGAAAAAAASAPNAGATTPETYAGAAGTALATPPGEQSAPESNPAAAAPAVPATSQPPEAKAATQAAPNSAAPAPASESGSSSRSDVTYHVVEALAAAIALAAAAGTIVWRVRNRKVEP